MSQINRLNINGATYSYARYRHGVPLPEEATEGSADTEEPEPDHHDSGQRSSDGELTLKEGAGSLSKQACYRDRWTFSDPPGFPRASRESQTSGFQPARTTFHAKEAPDEGQFDDLWVIQHGLDGWSESPIDEVDRGHRLHRERRDKHLAGEATMQALDVPEDVRKRALELMSKSKCRIFSRHYAGVHGGAIGFALVVLFETPTDAMNSPYWNRVQEICSDLDIDPEGLVDLVFRKFGSMEEEP